MDCSPFSGLGSHVRRGIFLQIAKFLRHSKCHLAGSPDDDPVYKAKSHELKAEAARAEEALAQLGDVDPARAETALTLFDWTQNAVEIWRSSNNRVRREILDSICLNRTLTDVNLNATKRKPFDVLAEGLNCQNSRDDKI